MQVMKDTSGQMTVEAVIALPVMIAIAVMAMNALLFFESCAVFDRQFRLAVTTFATSPAHGEGQGACAGQVEAALRETVDFNYTEVAVTSSDHALGQVTYTGTLRFSPTLFGNPFSGSVFGVSLPPIMHQTEMTIEPYKPGGII